MKKTAHIIILVCILSIIQNIAYSQDTTIVQTFKFSDITKRRGWYVFPSDTNSYQKILMYYTLKCDYATTYDGFPCGEWDMSTYTEVFDHQNRDGFFYEVQGSYVDSVNYTINPLYSLHEKYFQQIIYDSIITETDFVVGNGVLDISHPFSTSINKNRTYYLYTSAELTSEGLTAGSIDKLKYDVSAVGHNVKNLSVRFKHTSQNTLTQPEFTGFQEVFSNNIVLSSGIKSLDLTNPFIWDGTSNILIEISFENSTSTINSLVKGMDVGYQSSLWLHGTDGYINNIKYDDYTIVPDHNELDFSTNFSIEAWIKPTYFSNDIKENTIVGKDADMDSISGYVLRCGGNGVLNFTVGTSVGWIDISSASNALVLNKWQHVAGTFSGDRLKIYVDGTLVGSKLITGEAVANTMDLYIGAGYNGGNRTFYGFIDDIRLWSKTLSIVAINDWAYRDISSEHPDISYLVANYSFNNQNHPGFDFSGNNHHAYSHGNPEWNSFSSESIFKGYNFSSERPNITFSQGDYQSHIDSAITVDTVIQPNLRIVRFELSNIDTNLNGIVATPVDTILAWDYGWQYTYDVSGNKKDSVFIDYDSKKVSDYKHTVYQVQHFITPYGIGLDLGPDGFRWVYDVTDYAPLFHDTVELRAGNTAELLDLKFIMIKGTPPRDVLNVEQIWLGSFLHKDIANDDAMPAVDYLLDPAASQFRVKTRTTGHRFGGFENCAEFCYKLHHVKIDGVKRFEWLNWKECADNPVIAQGGTWIFDRTGWCPGEFADTYDHEITPFVNPGNIVSIDYGMEYTEGGMEGDYITSVQLVSYGAPNFSLDASIQEIISPNDWEYHNRVNPICTDPKIIIKNTGSTTLTSLDITYTIEGGTPEVYNWTGNLEFLKSEEVILPVSSQDFWNSESAKNIFQVSVSNPNGATDEYADNNFVQTGFEKPPVYQGEVVLYYTTNLAARENSYTIKDAQGNIRYSADYFSLLPNKTYRETFQLSSGCYVLEWLDSGHDGLSFFANYDGDGSLYILDGNTGTPHEIFNPDYGSFIKHHFIVESDFIVTDNHFGVTDVDIYPNPVKEYLTIDLQSLKNKCIEIEIIDAVGIVKLTKTIQVNSNDFKMPVNLSEYSSGIYFIKLKTGNGVVMKQFIKE